MAIENIATVDVSHADLNVRFAVSESLATLRSALAADSERARADHADFVTPRTARRNDRVRRAARRDVIPSLYGS